MSRAYFITGTDTEIGKTFTAAALTHAFSELGDGSTKTWPRCMRCSAWG